MNKSCEVCNDIGFGRNFGVITCESCKGFFRRFANKDQELLVCPSNGKCHINPLTRNICKRCRLDKCLLVGMKKEFIRNAAENELRKQLIRENKIKRKLHNKTKSIVSLTDKSLENSMDSVEGFGSDILNDLLSDPISDHEIQHMIAELENYSTFKSNAKSEDNNSLSDNMTIIPIFRELNDYNGLNELESNRINELMSASHVFSAQLTQNTRHIKSLEEWMRHSVELNEKSIKDMASFITKLNGFTNICPDDQLALFKYGYNELTCIYYCKYYIRESDCFLVPLDNNQSGFVKTDIFKFGDYSIRQMVEKYAYDILLSFICDDMTIILLLKAIILFNPNRPNLSHKLNVKLEQQLYIYLLQRYLLLKCRSKPESQTMLQKLMTMLMDVHFVSELELTHGMQEYRQYIHYFGPLMREIYPV